MTQGFSRSDRNEYMVLQNYKLLARAFNKLGWRKFDPERYVKKKEKDYIALAEFLRKTLTSHALNDSPRMEKPKCLLSKHTLSTNKVLAFSQSIIQTSDPLQALEKKKQKLLSATIAIQHEIGAA